MPPYLFYLMATVGAVIAFIAVAYLSFMLSH